MLSGTAAIVANPATLSNPVGWIVGGATALVSAIVGIFTHHAQAVKNEAAALNTAVPLVQQSITQVFDYLNAGKITPDEATKALDLTVGQYENFVYDRFQVKRKDGNGPDFIEDNYVAKWIAAAKGLITSGGGSYTSESLNPPGNGFNGFGSFTVAYQRPTAASLNVDGTANSTSNLVTLTSGADYSWLLWVLGGLILLKVLRVL